jgi:hypothetical protein
MESRSAQAAAPGELRGARAVARVGDFRRRVHMVARGDRIGGVAPRALLRRRLPLRHAILICATERGGSAGRSLRWGNIAALRSWSESSSIIPQSYDAAPALGIPPVPSWTKPDSDIP